MAYTDDGKQLLWKGKPARLKKGARGRRLTDTFATDGSTLYFAQKKVALPDSQPLDLGQLRLRAFGDSAMNMPPAVLSDGRSVFFLGQPGLSLDRLIVLPGAEFETVDRFRSPGGIFDLHLRDARHVWYRGSQIEGLSAPAAKAVAENLCVDKRRVFVLGESWPGLEPKAVTRVGRTEDPPAGDLVRVEDELWFLDPGPRTRTVVARRSTRSSPNGTAQKAVHTLSRALFGLLSNHAPMTCTLQDLEWDELEQVDSVDVSARFDGATLVVSIKGEKVETSVSGWLGALTQVWSRRHELSDDLVLYPQPGLVRSDGTELREHLIRQNPSAYLDLCGVAFAQGDEVGARLLLDVFDRTYDGDFSPYREDLFQTLANAPRGLFDERRTDRVRGEFSSSTGLANVKKVIASGRLVDADPRIRLETLELVHAALFNTSDIERYFKPALPAVLACQAKEREPGVREHVDAVVDGFILKAMLTNEFSIGVSPQLIEPLIRSQLERRVNVTVNGLRLVEVLLQQDRFDDADAGIRELRSSKGISTRPFGGLHSSRPSYRWFDLALLHAHLRAAKRPGVRAVLTQRKARIERLLHTLKAQHGPALAKERVWANIQADLATVRSEFGLS
jgi:hypothetical protein